MSRSVDRVNDDVMHILCAALKQLHLLIGAPKFIALQALATELAGNTPGMRFLSKTSINDTVNGKRVTIPDWEWVRSFVIVCRVYAERNQIPCLNRLADIEYWHDLWYKAQRSSITTAPHPVYDDPTAADHEEADHKETAPPSKVQGVPSAPLHAWAPGDRDARTQPVRAVSSPVEITMGAAEAGTVLRSIHRDVMLAATIENPDEAHQLAAELRAMADELDQDTPRAPLADAG